MPFLTRSMGHDWRSTLLGCFLTFVAWLPKTDPNSESSILVPWSAVPRDSPSHLRTIHSHHTGLYVANLPNCKPTKHSPVSVCCQPTAWQTNESHAGHAELRPNAIHCNSCIPTILAVILPTYRTTSEQSAPATLARMLPTYSTPNQRSHDNHAQLYPDAISTPLFPPASMLPTYPTASQLHTGPYVANLQHSKPTKP